MGNCNFTPTLFNLLSFRLGGWHSSYSVLYLLLQYGNSLVWSSCAGRYGVGSTENDKCSVSFAFLSVVASSPGQQVHVRTYTGHRYLTIWTYHHCCDDPRGADAFSALDLAARRSVSGTMDSCRDFCACTILQSSCCLGAIIMAALRRTEIHWAWKRLKTRAIHGKEPMLSSVTEHIVPLFQTNSTTSKLSK